MTFIKNQDSRGVVRVGDQLFVADVADGYGLCTWYAGMAGGTLVVIETFESEEDARYALQAVLGAIAAGQKVIGREELTEPDVSTLAEKLRRFLGTPIEDDLFGDEVPTYRDRVCAVGLWEECLGGVEKDMTHADSLAIGKAMDELKGVWERSKSPLTFPGYGRQRGWVRRRYK